MALPPPPERKANHGRDHGMQRIRVGVTGLAAVFLLTLLAASLFALLGQDVHNPARGPDRTAAAQAADAPKEPLAELGVAPGNAPKTPGNEARPAPAHPAVPAPKPAVVAVRKP